MMESSPAPTSAQYEVGLPATAAILALPIGAVICPTPNWKGDGMVEPRQRISEDQPKPEPRNGSDHDSA